MAIKRLDPKALFLVISATDEALDNETDAELQSEEKNEDGSPKQKVTRYEEYIEELKLDESKLKFKEGHTPDRFVLRALTADELADINSRYIYVDTLAKKMVYTNRNKMFLEMFTKTFQGLQGPNGSTQKVDTTELPYNVQIEMGAVVSLIASLGKNEKK